MATSLVDDLTGLFRSQALGEAAAKLGESESSVLRGFQTASAAILGGLTSRIGQTGFMKQAFDLSSTFSDSRVLDNVRGFFSGSEARTGNESAGSKLLSMVFGNNQSKIAESVSQASGLRPSSATTLMSVAAPVVLGLLGKRVQQDHLDNAGFSNLLQRESSGIRGLLPSGLSNLLGMAPSPGVETRAAIEPVRTSRRLWPLLVLFGVIAALLWLFSRNSIRVATVAENAGSQVQSAASSLGDFYRRTLASGVELNIPRFGIESKLLDFIKDPARAVDTTTWFDFDRLSFDTNSAALRAESQEQLNNIASILKAYPNLHIKVGGYTDNTGDASANFQLSQARADSVRQQLISMGIGADRLEAKGYGDQYPIGDNSTEAGRARNRRISLLVTQK